MADALDPCYRQNPDYRPHQDGTFWLLQTAAGWGLACDEPVYRVWSAFDGRPTAEVISTLTAETGLSAAFVECTAKVLARAGVLLPSLPLPPLPRLPAGDIADLQPFPLVSVIILASRQARVHLETCLPSVLAQTYPNLEIILVDNQTTDDSAAFTRQHFPQVKILTTPRPMGFAEANNLAMEQAQGEFLFLVNEDTEMEPDCVAECVRVMLRSERIAAAAPKMKLYYMRHFFNSMGNSLHPDGNSHDNFIGYLDAGQFDGTDQVFTACFGAAMLRRSVVKEIGGMDPEFFVYYADTDWCFRARLCGYDVVAAPRAVIYHKFTATVNTMASTFKLELITYSRPWFAWKNLDFRRASRFLWFYLQRDFGGYLWARRQGLPEVAATLRRSWGRWLRALPRATLARWRTRRLRRPPFSDDAALALTAIAPRPAMYGQYPVIAAPFIRGHYMHLETFRPESAPTAADLAPTDVPPPSSVSYLGRRAWQTFRERGLRGLVDETRCYFLWRISPR